jgi:hypothetical protein
MAKRTAKQTVKKGSSTAARKKPARAGTAARPRPAPARAEAAGGERMRVKAGSTAKQLAALLDIELTKPLSPDEVFRLRKALPGYAAQLDDAASRLDEETLLPKLLDFTSQDLLDAHRQQAELSQREAAAKAAYEAVYYQRLKVDDRGVAMLQKLGRRIDMLAEDDPGIRDRWKTLRDFLAKFRPGPGARNSGGSEPQTPPSA